MVDNSQAEFVAPDETEREFAETLRAAAFIFETEKNGRFQGSIMACKAVARFIYRRGGGAELAGAFLQIAAAFEELDRGGKPKLFSKKSTPEKERERSPERKHIHMLAAAVLELMVKLETRGSKDDNGINRGSIADMIARHVNKWPGMAAQEVTGRTVIAWRNQQRKLSEAARRPFDTLVQKTMAEQDPEQTVNRLLKSGPPGYWKS